mmetsp:Transcript_58709/g.137989  ORF Transcript_58709/g.137989 Transcript_58709/m.137989 type:complete len:207 (-) Transcript_58709:1103-1723(-)
MPATKSARNGAKSRDAGACGFPCNASYARMSALMPVWYSALVKRTPLRMRRMSMIPTTTMVCNDTLWSNRRPRWLSRCSIERLGSYCGEVGSSICSPRCLDLKVNRVRLNSATTRTIRDIRAPTRAPRAKTSTPTADAKTSSSRASHTTSGMNDAVAIMSSHQKKEKMKRSMISERASHSIPKIAKQVTLMMYMSRSREASGAARI